jgi:hypothetical protein
MLSGAVLDGIREEIRASGGDLGEVAEPLEEELVEVTGELPDMTEAAPPAEDTPPAA